MSSILSTKFPDYIERLLALRKAKELHTVVENKLIQILGIATPDLHPIKEIQGLPGGRNDLMLFDFNGRKVVFEVFATASQVSRDLLILYKTKADIKIAVILDKEADPKVFNNFLKQNPDEPFPFLFIGELFDDPPPTAGLKLREIIIGDKEALFKRMLRAKISRVSFLDWCRKNGIEVFSKSDVTDGSISYAKVFMTVVIEKLKTQGISREKLKKLGIWLSQEKTLNYIFTTVDIGLNMFLYTDLDENFAAYSDLDLVDWIRAGQNFSSPYVLMSLNAVIYEIENKCLKSGGPILNPDRKITMTIGASQLHETSTGRMLICSLPSRIESVTLLPPAQPDRPIDQYLELVKMIE